jgi:hypothetical protein
MFAKHTSFIVIQKGENRILHAFRGFDLFRIEENQSATRFLEKDTLIAG